MSRISLRVGFSAAGSVSSASFALFLKNIGLIPVGHDLSSRVLDNRHLSRYLSSPVTKHEAYKDFLRSFILNHCDLYLPFLDSELQVCFELKKESELFSTRIPLSDSSTIQACDDKLHLKELLSSCGINCIPQPDCVPVVVKPRRGSGGKEILIIRIQFYFLIYNLLSRILIICLKRICQESLSQPMFYGILKVELTLFFLELEVMVVVFQQLPNLSLIKFF